MDSAKCMTCDNTNVPLNPVNRRCQDCNIKQLQAVATMGLGLMASIEANLPEGRPDLRADLEEASVAKTAADVVALASRRLRCQTCRAVDVVVDPKRRMCEQCMIAEMEFVIRQYK